MLKKTSHLLLFNSLVIGFILLASEQNGFAGFATIASDCCQISENECSDNSEGPIVCMEGDLVENAFCDENLGICRVELTPIRRVRPIPTLSEWGLIAAAGILGLAGLVVLKRKKAAA